MNPLQKLAEYGQAIWLDDIHRDLMTSGQLKLLIEKDGLRGMTSNPSIFNKAIADTSNYDAELQASSRQGKSASEVFEALAIKDVQMAAEEFRPLYDQTQGVHGYVSLEVNPHLAHDTEKTIHEARRLWHQVNRPNIYIKVPGTKEGLPAIQQLISEGINVNVTLLFGLPRYAEVANAFMAGIEARLQNGGSVERVQSVASFFLSRIDVLLDPRLEEFMHKGGKDGELAKQLHGELAIASARNAYQIYKEIVAGDRWRALEQQGARRQWLLWASTSTKNPQFSDVKYVESLIGPETVNTVPMKTLQAFRDHGRPAARLEDELETAQQALARLPRLGLDIDEATEQLEDEGVEKFCKAYDALLKTLEQEIMEETNK